MSTGPSTSRRHTLSELADVVGGAVRGDRDCVIHGVNGLADACAGELTFFGNPKYREALKTTKASAVVVNEAGLSLLNGRDAIVVSDPSLAFAKVSAVFHPLPCFSPGVDPRAVVEPGAEVDPSATVMAFCFVSRGARVGARTLLFPGVFIGEHSVVGADAILYPGVVIRETCAVGDRSVLQPGAVIGGDGFGFAFDLAKGEHCKVPQAGSVEIEEDVEVGANSAIDRATLGKTRVGRGAKIDNLVQVGHNVTIGPLAILCGQVGIGGSSEVGRGAILGGQVGVADHVKIADAARFIAQSGIMSDIEEPGAFGGSPAREAKEWLKASAAFYRGPETRHEIARLRQQVAELADRLERMEKK